MDKKKDNKNKPLKLSSTGRLQIRKNLGPSGDKSKSSGNKKTIQIVFRNKNNQQKSSSTSQSNFRGSSSFRSAPNQLNRSSPSQINPNFSQSNKSKSFENKSKKTSELKNNNKKNLHLSLLMVILINLMQKKYLNRKTKNTIDFQA